MEEGMCLMTEAGWLEFGCTYIGLELIFTYGWKVLLARSRVTSRKSTCLTLVVTIVLRPKSLNTLWIIFLIWSTLILVEFLTTNNPSFLYNHTLSESRQSRHLNCTKEIIRPGQKLLQNPKNPLRCQNFCYKTFWSTVHPCRLEQNFDTSLSEILEYSRAKSKAKVNRFFNIEG